MPQTKLSAPTCASKSGFTVIETLVAVGVLAIFFASIAYILQQVLINVGESRVRSVALALAQEKMELVRNLPYNQVGTTGGIPQGPILQTETVKINTQDFLVKTSVVYIDDPFDGVAPADVVNTDYKRARVEITWGGVYPSRVPVTLVTNIVPKGVETTGGGGTLVVRVFNSLGEPVPNASVTIDNTAVVPAIHTTTLSSSTGYVTLPGSPACISCYQIQVSKSGYSSDRTYSTGEVTNPLQPYASVNNGQISQMSFAIDLVSSVIVNSYGSRESGYPTISNVFFTLKGSKIIGHDSQDNPVYKYAYLTNTGGGTVQISGLEWDTYTLDFTSSGHVLAGSNPVVPFALLSNTNMTVAMVAVPKSANSLLVIVKNNSNELQASASAQLTNTSFGYDTTITTAATGSADFGQAFFGGLTAGVYDLKVDLNSYQEATSSITITGIKQEYINLNPL